MERQRLAQRRQNGGKITLGTEIEVSRTHMVILEGWSFLKLEREIEKGGGYGGKCFGEIGGTSKLQWEV